MPAGPLAHFLTHPRTETSHLLHHLLHLLVALGVVAGPLTIGAALAAGSAAVLVRRRSRARLADGARSVRVLAPPEVDPNGALTLWTNLVALLRPAWRRALGTQPHLGFEVTAGPGGLTIALWVPAVVPRGMVERAIEAAWPGSRTETTAATPPISEGVATTGGELRLAQPEHYPIRTEHRVDPLRPLLGALSGLDESETACVQVLARPVTGRRLTRAHRAASLRRSGRPAARLARLIDLVTPGPTAQPPALDPSRGADVAAILEKAAEPCWAITIRYGVTTTEVDPAARARLRGRAHALASAFALYAGRNRFDRHRLTHPSATLAARRLGRGDLVSVTELAALAHLPTDQVVAGLARAGARTVAPPPAVATTATAGAKVLGQAETGARRSVTLAVADARHHLHVMGATGSGKSTLLTNLVLGDIEAGRGVVVIDPKGDLVTDICARMPDGAEDRVVLIDPEEREAPPVMNVLSGPDPDLVTDNLVGIFRSIFSAFWGPRTDDVLRAACLTLLRSAAEGDPASLADVPRLLADEEFRRPLVAQVDDDAVGLGGFWKWYEQMGDASRAQVIGPVMNKLRAFLLRDFVRQVVGRAESSFDMDDVLDGGICLVRVPKGTLGEETSRLLGSFVVAKVWQAATHRARLGGAARADAALYVDECQNFLNLPRSFDEMLAEARGYGLSMTLAHQHLAQLPKDLRDAVSANARTKVLFSMSPEDAHVLARHVAPELTEHDLSHLGAFQAAARLVVRGEETPAFTLRTMPARPPVDGRLAEVRTAARAKGRPASKSGVAPLTFRTTPEAMVPAGTRSRHVGRDETGGVTGGRSDARGVVSGIALSDDPALRSEQAGQAARDGSSLRADLVRESGDVSW
ncbi:MAG: helicase HerA domain-containing protein [Acidimicrobiales bacterium]